jgi:hypothetical protein
VQFGGFNFTPNSFQGNIMSTDKVVGTVLSIALVGLLVWYEAKTNAGRPIVFTVRPDNVLDHLRNQLDELKEAGAEQNWFTMRLFSQAEQEYTAYLIDRNSINAKNCANLIAQAKQKLNFFQ